MAPVTKPTVDQFFLYVSDLPTSPAPTILPQVIYLYPYIPMLKIESELVNISLECFINFIFLVVRGRRP